MKKEKFLEYFKNVPVSVNNLYGDPFFPLQEENTFKKLDSLKSTGHKGIVAIITKSEITEEQAIRLQKYAKYLKLIVLVSISGLPNKVIKGKPYECTSNNRYNGLKNCKKYNIPALAYVRPFIPPYNTSRECIENIFKSVSESGIDIMVVSGLRGNDEILLNSGISEEEKEKWSFRVKIIPTDVRKLLNEFKEKYNIKLFERTSCGVAYALGEEYSYNPYQASPQLAKCYNCLLKSTCFDKKDSEIFKPTEEDLELINMLGYSAHINTYDTGEVCKVNPLKRTECESCCTSCYKLKRNSIELENVERGISLGDTSMLRLLTKKLVYGKGVREVGDKNVAYPTSEILKGLPIYMVNSWWVYARSTSYCYNCSYCMIGKYYSDCKKEEELGSNPSEVAEIIWNRCNQKQRNEMMV